MIMRCLAKPERLFNSMPRAGPRDLANQALRYGTVRLRRVESALLYPELFSNCATQSGGTKVISDQIN